MLIATGTTKIVIKLLNGICSIAATFCNYTLKVTYKRAVMFMEEINILETLGY
jgi:hypothetical protein